MHDGQTVNYIDYDKTVLDTEAHNTHTRQVTLQQLVKERPELAHGKAFVDGKTLLESIGPSEAEIKLHGSFTIAVQHKFGLSNDWADKTLELRFPAISAFMKENRQHMPVLNEQLLQLEQRGHLNVIVTQNYREVVEEGLENAGLLPRFEGRIMDRRTVGDKTTGLAVRNLKKRFGRFQTENYFDDLVYNLIWPYLAGGRCWLIGPTASRCGTYHHHHATLTGALDEMLLAA